MATYYLSAVGITSNTGLSTGSPWPISKLNTIGVGGDTIYINKGDSFLGSFTYTRSGTSGNRITIDAYGSGANPEFNGNGGNSGAFILNGANFVTVNNIVGKNTSLSCEAPFQIYNCHDVRIYNCFAGFGKRGMRVFNTTGNIVIDTCWFSNFQSPDGTNTIVGNGGGSGVQWDSCSGSGNKTINSKFYTVIGAGTNPTPGVGDVISHYKCYFGTADVFGAGNFGYEATNNKVRGGGSSSPGYAGTVGGDVGGANQYIHDNWFINAGKVGAQVQGGTNINMSNNIIANDVFTWIATSGPNPSVGVAFGNYSGLACNNVTIGGNKICFHKSGGAVFNKWWDPGAKTFPAFQPTGWTTNTADGTCDVGASTSSIPNPLFAYGDWNSGGTGLVFGSLPTKTYGAADFAPGATSSNAITYTSSNTSVATIVSGNIHIVGFGTSTITANDGTTSIPQTLTVNKAALLITANNQTKVYHSGNPGFTYTYTGFVNGETNSALSTLPTSTTSANTTSTVGTYSIVPSGAAGANYSISYTNGTLTITKASLTITADSKSKIYATVNPTFTITYTGFLGSDTSANLTGIPVITTSAVTSSSVGSYTLSIAGATSPDYNITYVTGTLIITKAALTATATSLSKVQGSVNPTLTQTFTGFVNSDTSASITVPTLSTTAVTGSAVGTYPITNSGGSATNYNFTYVPGTLSITSTPLVFGAIASQVYGVADFSPGATGAGSITYTSSNSAVATIVSNNIHIIGVGTSTITATDGVSSIPQTLIVTKANLTITADNYAIAVGSSIPTLTVSYSGFVYSDTTASLSSLPTITTTATGGSPVGAYPITASGATAANYTFTYVDAVLSIVPNGQIIFHIGVTLL